ncbi:trehalose-phosphatase [Kineobactrum sediminis]|uniref:trehalose-phosphatase n=1 Tax=Kineobactrum sediminis TaxID=1905677 RepID=UPI0019D45FA8|nr:trehalose-phosphatase [Kineobactrum sediminis]
MTIHTWSTIMVDINIRYGILMTKPHPSTTLSPVHFDAVIFDLDGVITQTAEVHARAWKRMFDDYLGTHTDKSRPFDMDTDYRNYVDGKPRYDGVASFLASRDIELPYGDEKDSPDTETICGLGNRKNILFNETLKRDGVNVYDSSIALIKALHAADIHTAIVSSSRNCKAVLEAAGISDLFEARVDGVDLELLKLPGKPAPDMFLEAARRLASKPQRCVGIEDASSGVESLRAADFGCVIGVNRGDYEEALFKHGADIVVSDLGELRVASPSDATAARDLPSALDCMNEIDPGNDHELAIFLDYDGSLTPIVDNPDNANLSDTMRKTLEDLAEVCELSIISGRDLADVRKRVALENIWYAGSHGFDMAGPRGERTQYQEGRSYLPVLDRAEDELNNLLADVPGVRVERKHFSIATHYRQVAPDHVQGVKDTVAGVHADHPELRMTTGKKIVELQPDIDWDKGQALRWLMQALSLDSERFIPLYIGDDVTDEDAFREIETEGIGILVAEQPQPTHANYHLANPDEVEIFLKRLTSILQGGDE